MIPIVLSPIPWLSGTIEWSWPQTDVNCLLWYAFYDYNLVSALRNVSVPTHTITVSKLTMIFRVEWVFYRTEFQIKLFLEGLVLTHPVNFGFRQVSMGFRPYFYWGSYNLSQLFFKLLLAPMTIGMIQLFVIGRQLAYSFLRILTWIFKFWAQIGSF